MLPKKNRINNRQLIQKLFQKGKTYKNGCFIFRYLFSEDNVSQFVTIISKKISKKAVSRNRLRRQIHEALRKQHLILDKPVVSAIILKASACDKSFQSLDSDIQDFINHLTS